MAGPRFRAAIVPAAQASPQRQGRFLRHLLSRHQGRPGLKSPSSHLRSADDNAMCGRFLLMTSGPVLAERFDLSSFPELKPQYNIAPSQDVPAVRIAGDGRQLALLGWGRFTRLSIQHRGSAFSPDGHYLAVTTENQLVQL